MEQRELRNIFGQFASGVTVITCANSEGLPHGATVTAFTAVSIEPRLCQITLTRKSKACNYLSKAPFAVNILAADQVDTAMHFAGRPQNPEPVWADGPTAPIICGAAATLSCRPWAEYDGGDHIIFIGEIVTAESSGKDPLLFYRSTFHDLGSPSASAAWNGSMDDPNNGWFDSTTSFTPFHLQPVN
ncbi:MULTISPECIES: flavin reductase family protein [Rhodococcus]|uniref:flavin reductase family protein n=1 Tax=Rhodococcus TaxID=1827 RepID=UPI0013BFFCBB|nr:MULTISPECIES: flavin reductase family protein [Rhodococcus]MDI9952473.1 flavin reductase family protein [Rhodococcus sp. IEGM 1305]MDI9976616.1 flavin reductase family protein [Rhodococcus sp. IEGM 1307]MDV7083825.1 flavin reductase family protein [Rhodococcus opacus]NDV04421.1 flavin reductase family protein [Rhodococcus sp. IEGM 248]